VLGISHVWEGEKYISIVLGKPQAIIPQVELGVDERIILKIFKINRT
jgi:hypothetical protein